ncbi:hypothetical protein N7E02_05880 (plasmid) [Aliirhizobium terrae]|uniref:slr1658 superfamily regulator n=1 Tax=Terrirhizobium terrae TaxID=2926709 RepID=UPI00257677CD|nr:hypothetical protein [Rhizobium sp. CC-CFT758]WJH38213.1 hypothetical protein N7E02_05880 [Rhizobium sp. CC-CFT758]
MSRTILGTTDLAEASLSSGARLTLMDGPLELSWRLSGLTSDFLAEAMALPFTSSKTRHANVHHSIEYLSNELIENALKFRQPSDIVIEACVDADLFLMRVRNEIDSETSTRFRNLLTDILSADPGELLIQQIEANAASNASGSGLGILTLLADYGAELAWEFEGANDQRIQLTTTASVQIPLA